MKYAIGRRAEQEAAGVNASKYTVFIDRHIHHANLSHCLCSILYSSELDCIRHDSFILSRAQRDVANSCAA